MYIEGDQTLFMEGKQACTKEEERTDDQADDRRWVITGRWLVETSRSKIGYKTSLPYRFQNTCVEIEIGHK